MDVSPQHRVWYICFPHQSYALPQQSWCVIPNRVAFPSRSPEQRFVLIAFPQLFPEWSGFNEIYLQQLSYLWIGGVSVVEWYLHPPAKSILLVDCVGRPQRSSSYPL